MQTMLEEPYKPEPSEPSEPEEDIRRREEDELSAIIWVVYT